MTKHTVFLGLGTNLGDREANLLSAIFAMPPFVVVLEKSSVYETPPWGYEEQPDFLNQVIKGETELGEYDLLYTLKGIEAELGREPTFRYGPRLIDIDILFYDDLVLQTKKLSIPHPRLHDRAFVLVPLAEIAPGLIHPALGESVQSLLSNHHKTNQVKRVE